MKKIYKLHNLIKLTLLIAVFIFGYTLWQQWQNNQIDKVLLVSGSISAILLIFGWSAKIQITDREFINLLPFLGMKKIKRWEDIRYVIDDYFWIWHRFPLSTDGKKSFGGISNGIANHRDLLREIVLRVPKDCQVDETILQRTGLTRADIGKLFKR